MIHLKKQSSPAAIFAAILLFQNQAVILCPVHLFLYCIEGKWFDGVWKW